MCVTMAFAGIALAAGCGSSGGASATVPATAGLGMSRAMAALCASGFKVTVNVTPSPAVTASAATNTDRHVVVTGTIPPAGTAVAKGSVVVLRETEPHGVESLFATTDNCLAPTFQTITTSAAGRAAISAVAASPAGRDVAAQFPAAQASKTCRVLPPAPATATPVSAICSTFVSGGGGPQTVTYAEAWGSAHARRATGLHFWSFLVQPHHDVELGASIGDPPRRVVG